MAVNVYDLSGRRLYRRRTLDAVMGDWPKSRPGYVATWDDSSGERWERKGGQWRQTEKPDREIAEGTLAKSATAKNEAAAEDAEA